MGLNWVDGVIAVATIYYLIQGWEIGLIAFVLNPASFLALL